MSSDKFDYARWITWEKNQQPPPNYTEHEDSVQLVIFPKLQLLYSNNLDYLRIVLLIITLLLFNLTLTAIVIDSKVYQNNNRSIIKKYSMTS